MKFRRDFVTNSSSSSFVCDICGRVESGWDIGLDEAGMLECENGHIFCEDEKIMPKRETMISVIEEDLESGDSSLFGHTKETISVLSDEDLFDLYLSLDDMRWEVPEECCPICQFIEYSNIDLAKYLEKEYKVSRDEVFAMVKEKNKRRKKLYDTEYIVEVCKRFDLDPIAIVSSLKEKFGTYKNFHRFLYGR